MFRRDALDDGLRTRRLLDRHAGHLLAGVRGRFHHLVAGGQRTGLVQFVVPQAGDRVVGRLEVHVRYQHYAHLEPRLHRMELAALLVQQVGRHLDGHLGVHRRGVLLHRLFLQDAQDVQRGGFDAADVTDAVAAGAGDVAGFTQRGLQPLAREFHQAEARDLADLHACTVVVQGVAQAVFHFTLVLGRLHVDEVDHHQAAQVAQAQLARDLVGSLHVGVERGGLDVVALGSPRRVDVDRHQRFGVVDDHGTAGGQRHLPRIRGLDLMLDLEAREERHVVAVELHAVHVLGHHVTHELARLLEDRFVVDQQFADVVLEVVPDGTNDQRAFLVDQERAALRLGGILDGLPQAHQVAQVAVQLFDRAADAGSAGDEAHAARHFQLLDRVAQLVALFTLDPARNPAAARVVGHQDDVATGQAHVRGQCRTLGAALVLVHLDDDFLAFLQRVLDAGARGIDALGEVLAADFLERQESVPVGTVVDERRFEAGLDAGDDAFVDVTFALLFS